MRPGTLLRVLACALLLPGLAIIQAPTAQGLVRAFDIYMDQPFVQGSYISPDSDASTQTFNSFPTTGDNSCTNADIGIGTISGTCSVYDSVAFGASDTSANQYIGGPGSKMVSGHPGTNYKVNFAAAKKYVGFWWAAGSNGNVVRFYSHGAVVASLNVNQVFGMFGTSPFGAVNAGDQCYGQPGETATAVGVKCFGNSMSFSDSAAIVTSINNTKYLKNLYFGNPNGYTAPSGGATSASPSSILFAEPFVYIHAFASNGADFDAVEFSGSGFEIDNLTVATDQKTARGELVFVQSVPGNYVATFDSQGGSSTTSGTFASGGQLSAPTSPTRSGYSFAGWTESTTSTTGLNFPYTPGVDSDITLYAKWFRYGGPSPSSGLPSGSWITLTGENLSHSTSGGFGYQTVYFRSVANASGASPGSWTALNSSDVRDGTGTQIQVKVPSSAGVQYYQFHVDVCRNWTAVVGCVALDNSATYSIAPMYTVTYDSNSATSGSVPTDSSSPYLSGSTVTMKINSGSLARSGYTFTGWNELANGNGASHPADGVSTLTMGTSNVTLFATWSADTHTVTFNTQGGSSESSTTFVTDGNLILPSAPTRSGYNFLGWFAASSGGTALNSPYSPGVASDITIFAQWQLVNSGGSTPSPSQNSSPSVELRIPGIVWEPHDLSEGEAIGDLQLNATFSVKGTAVYSVAPGYKPTVGKFIVTVTFTPDDRAIFAVLSTSRTINVSAHKESIPPSSEDSLHFDAKPSTVTAGNLRLVCTIYFNNNEYFLDAGDRSQLREVAKIIKVQSIATVIIKGNTDIKKGVDNYWLSRVRAEAVAKFLKTQNKSPEYQRVWYAYKRPVAKGLDKYSLALNRRVEIFALLPAEAHRTIG